MKLAYLSIALLLACELAMLIPFAMLLAQHP